MNNQNYTQIPQVQKQSIDKEMIIRIVNIVAGAFIILSIFIPYMRMTFFSYRKSFSIWSTTTILRFIVVIFGAIPILTAVFKKFKAFNLLSAGFILFSFFSIFDSWVRLDSRSYTHLFLGFFMMGLAALALVGTYVFENFEAIKKDIAELTKPKNTIYNANQFVSPVQSVEQVQPAPVEPVENQVLCSGCGNPKVVDKSFCTNCGKQF